MLARLLARGRRRGGVPPENRREAVTFLVLFLLGVLPYVNTLFNDFVYDDHFQVIQNPYVHSFRYLRQIFTTTEWKACLLQARR
jgi:hypothetical protein